MPRKPKPQDGPLPAGKGRSEILGKLYAPLEGLEGEELLKAVRRMNAGLRYHPDTRARQVIERHLTAAHMNPALAESPELSRFVFLMRELLAEHVPGMTLPQMLEPLQTLLARRDAGTGRPPSDHADEWLRMVEAKRKRNPALSVEAACQQVAGEWCDSGGRPRSFHTIKKAVTAKRKATGNPLSD